jgi:hypothetical protein
MQQQRKRYSADIKAKVALEAIKGQKTANGKSRCLTRYRTSSLRKGDERNLMKRSLRRSIRKSVSSKWNWIG